MSMPTSITSSACYVMSGYHVSMLCYVIGYWVVQEPTPYGVTPYGPVRAH